MDIFSKKRANDRLYAYHGGRFWVWNEELHGWKESHLMAQKYELNHDADKLLSPEDFLTDPAVFTRQQEAELRPDIAEALQRAQPCQNAPLDPVDETAVVAASSPGKPLTTIPDGMRPAFDYSGLDAQTVDALHMAESQYTQGKKMAETGLRWMVNAVAMAHDALCGAVVPQLDGSDSGACATVAQAHNNQHSESSFREWCEMIGISRSSAYNLLRVAERFGNIELDGKSILDVQPATLLYAVAKPSAPAELVEQVKNGDITTHKDYQALLAQYKAKDAELAQVKSTLDHEIDQNDDLLEKQGKLLRECEAAKKARMDVENKLDTAQADLTAALADVNGLTEQNARLNAEKEQAKKLVDAAEAREEEAWKMHSKAEQRAKAAEDALKHQPITGVVDKEEVKRQAEKLFDDMAGQLRQENDRLKKNSAQMERQMKAMTSRMNDLDQTDFDTANYFANTVLALWNSCKGSYSRLSGEDLESTFQYICNTLNNVREEAARLCRQPDGYEGGESNA